MDTFLKAIGVIVVAIIFGLCYACLMAYPVKWLWNDIAVELFAMKHIDAWQAWKLMFLCSLLFKSGSSSSDSKRKPTCPL